MFTGIIEEVGTVTDLAVVAPDVDGSGARAELVLRATTVVADAAPGDSIAVDGCCLTVARRTDDGFVADLMAETLRATALGDLAPGVEVNLERAMAADGRFDGHVVQGHVDGVGTVTDRRDEPGTTWLSVRAPAAVAPTLVPKGSITLAGASLTVVDVDDHDDGTATFRVGLIPHTLAHTTFHGLVAGDRVNLEADVVAKYVERLVAVHLADPARARAGRSFPAPAEPRPGSTATTAPAADPSTTPPTIANDRQHP